MMLRKKRSTVVIASVLAEYAYGSVRVFFTKLVLYRNCDYSRHSPYRYMAQKKTGLIMLQSLALQLPRVTDV